MIIAGILSIPCGLAGIAAWILRQDGPLADFIEELERLIQHADSQ
jgi:hypothetical protein